MNLKLKTGQKVLFVLSFLFLYLFLPFNNVKAQEDNIFFGKTPSEVNEVLKNCDQVTCNGIICSIAEAVEQITSQQFAEVQCVMKNKKTAGEIYEILEKKDGSLLTVTVGASQSLIDQRPASGVDFINDKVYALTNFGTVNAQDPQSYYPGAGADLLRPIQAFWGWSVNFVFSFLILLILAIAFAIIFRQRLGGAADVTIQNSIPNIAMALILVPLSYAISGLFIDAVTLGTNAVHGFLLGPGAPGRDVYETRNDVDAFGSNCEAYNPNDITSEQCDRGLYADDDRINIWNVRNKVSISDEIGNAIGATVGGANTNDTAISIVVGIFNVITGIINIIAGGNVDQYAWIGTIINFFISILTIWISIKIAWHLFQKFLTFLLMPIFAPFIFATVAFPGNGLKSVMAYAKQMGSASLAYIVTYMMFILTIVFTSEGFQSQFPDIRTGGYVPPLLGLDFIAAGTDTQAVGITSLVLSLVGIGIFFSIPNVLKSIDKSLGVEFAIPTFIKDPFTNMRESFNMTFRAAPSMGLDAGRRTLSAGKYLAPTPGRLRTAGGALRRFRDSQAGYTENDPQSRTAKRRTTYASQLSEVEKAIRDQTAIINNPTSTSSQRSAALNERSSLMKTRDGLISSANEEGFKNISGAEAKPPKLKVSFDPANGLNPLSESQYDRFLKAPNSVPNSVFDVGDFVFETENVDLPAQNIEVKVYKAEMATDTTREDSAGALINTVNRPILDASKTSGVKDTKGDPYMPFEVPNAGKLQGGFFVLDSVVQKTFIKEGDSKYKISLKFFITDPATFWAYWGPSPATTPSLNTGFMIFEMTGLGGIQSNIARAKIDIVATR